MPAGAVAGEAVPTDPAGRFRRTEPAAMCPGPEAEKTDGIRQRSGSALVRQFLPRDEGRHLVICGQGIHGYAEVLARFFAQAHGRDALPREDREKLRTRPAGVISWPRILYPPPGRARCFSVAPVSRSVP